MGLFDIIDDIAEKQVTKTDTGDNRIFGVVIGQVTRNYDKDMPGRVCVSIPTRDTGLNELKWARVAMPYGGSSWGQYFLPEVGDQVLVTFEQGNIEKPYIIGCIPKDRDRILSRSVDMANQYKKITTKNGNTIYFEDNKVGEGAKDKIQIYTSTNEHRIELDNELHRIVISDKDDRNKVVMKTQTGQMEIQAEKKLTIRVGETIELILNGNNGVIQIKSSKLKVEATSTVNVNSNGSAVVQAGNISVSANAILKLQSSGAATVSGMPIKIG